MIFGQGILKLHMKRNAKRKKFSEMSLDELSSYISRDHHSYLVQSLAAVSLCIQTITNADQQHNQYLSDLLQKLTYLMHTYLHQQEVQFFARISPLSLNKKVEDLPALLTETRKVHAEITTLFRQLDHISEQYTSPEDAPAATKLCYAQLFNFEQDVLTHILLKEDFLFPRLLKINKA
jgi:regulator of cell morphogenesis and NO signaling